MQVSFCGLKANIKAGRTAVRMVKEEYPKGFVSNSRYDTFSIKPNYIISKKLADLTSNMRDIVDYQKRINCDNYKAVEFAVKKTGVANCGEQSVIVSRQLTKQGIENKLVTLSLYNVGENSLYEKNSHTFCLIGYDNDIIISKPETWGDDAVIADMWIGSVDKASKLVKKYPEMLGYNKKTDKLLFHDAFF